MPPTPLVYSSQVLFIIFIITIKINAALLKFQGSANLTVEQVIKRRSEFLTTHRLNVISVRAEPGVVAISIARPHRRVLQLLELWKKWNPDCLNGNSELLIGLKEEDGNLLFLSPKKNAPHTLIAGSTGSGKSVLMQNIILSIAGTNTPRQSQIVLINPKLGVDYFAFERLPHLQGGIIDTQQEDISILNKLIDEMNRRYVILKQNSEIALGEKGAEHLLGKGHLAARLEGENSIITTQVPFISPEELENIVLQTSS